MSIHQLIPSSYTCIESVLSNIILLGPHTTFIQKINQHNNSHLFSRWNDSIIKLNYTLLLYMYCIFIKQHNIISIQYLFKKETNTITHICLADEMIIPSNLMFTPIVCSAYICPDVLVVPDDLPPYTWYSSRTFRYNSNFWRPTTPYW